MTIRNVQRISLGTDAAGFSFDSGNLAGTSSETDAGETKAVDFSKWKELEGRTLTDLRRNFKIGFASGSTKPSSTKP